mmetsp:Transcript_33598/g.51713  ORF Transcript_33598/g.51713 Transcript_33598/m.51713 type:complete len:368 (+) Transcript_33598:6090-7193(+)|eukprot:CAMPEP_0170488112 /NCGR_PEP_ID=MMETSP0208-20121228/6720_1 /TAXON_ID=197538 /ORGANISM="Strombidium inclinatum, Strain S3" /LENGTH=367 /DNA_ID=CAMNT_0010762563 /DNA_START=6035 /DNA_END=7138 /DNA_ORIENTATION=+
MTKLHSGSGVGSGDKEKEKSPELLGESIMRSPSVQVGHAMLSGRPFTPRSKSRRPSTSNFASKMENSNGFSRRPSRGETGMKQLLSPKEDLLNSIGSGGQGNLEASMSRRKMTEIHHLSEDPFKIRRPMRNDDSDAKLKQTPYSVSRVRPTKSIALSVLTGGSEEVSKKIGGPESQQKVKNKSPFLNPISEASANQPSSGLMRKKTGGLPILKGGFLGEQKLELPSRRDTSEDDSNYDSEAASEEEEPADDSYFTEANRKSSAFEQFQYAYHGDGNFDLYKNYMDPGDMQNYFEGDGGSEYGEAQPENSLSLISLDNPSSDPEKRIAQEPKFYENKCERMALSIIRVVEIDQKEAAFIANFEQLKAD